jgi:hypothetical protein
MQRCRGEWEAREGETKGTFGAEWGRAGGGEVRGYTKVVGFWVRWLEREGGGSFCRSLQEQ